MKTFFEWRWMFHKVDNVWFSCYFEPGWQLRICQTVFCVPKTVEWVRSLLVESRCAGRNVKPFCFEDLILFESCCVSNKFLKGKSSIKLSEFFLLFLIMPKTCILMPAQIAEQNCWRLDSYICMRFTTIRKPEVAAMNPTVGPTFKFF